MPRDRSGALRLGLCGDLVPPDPTAMDERAAARVAELGFAGVTTHIGSGLGLRPDDIDPETRVRIRATYEAAGVPIVHSWAFGANLVHPDRTTMERELELLGSALGLASDLGAAAAIGGCGSLNPAGRYAPHRENHSLATRARLVESLKAAAELAEAHGVALALEPHVVTTLDSPERVREIVDAAGSPFVRVNLDPANFVGDLATLWDSTRLVERVFDALAEVAVSGHVKDVFAADDFVIHLAETTPGDGELDLATYVRLFAERLPDRYLFVEHVPAALVPRAKAHVDRLCAELLVP